MKYFRFEFLAFEVGAAPFPYVGYQANTEFDQELAKNYILEEVLKQRGAAVYHAHEEITHQQFLNLRQPEGNLL